MSTPAAAAAEPIGGEERIPTCNIGKCTEPALFSPTLKRHIRECEQHQTARLDRDAKRRKLKQDTKKCMACSRPRHEDSVYCPLHLESHAARMKLRRKVHREAGVCVECGEEVAQTSKGITSKRCALHIEQQREYAVRIDSLSPEKRRHYAKYCSMCGVFRVHDSSQFFCTVCDQSRTQCIEYRWHEFIRGFAEKDSLWPPSSSTFSEKKAFGTLHCENERLVYADMVFLLTDRLIVLECDEFQHDSRDSKCESARMDSLQFGVPGGKILPTIILRFNPHQHDRRLVFSNLAERVEQYWAKVAEWLTCPASRLPAVENIAITYFYYAPDNKHVEDAQQQSRFCVQLVE